jgi:hypothetical protein
MILVGGLFVTGLAGLSIAANFWFGTLLTTGPERWLYGAVFALLDGFKTVLPIAASAAFLAGAFAKGRSAAALFALLSLLSFTAEIGLYATTKSEVVGDARAAHERYEQAKAAKQSADAALSALGSVRPPGEIEGDIAALKRDRLYDRSNKCQEATAAESRDLCAKIDRLAGELSKASEAPTLRRAAENAAVELQKQDVATAMRSIDPQAEALAKLLSVFATIDAETVRTGLAVLIALLIELGSGLGAWLLSGAGTTVPELVPAVPVERVPPVVETDTSVEQWASAALTTRRSAYLPASEARAAYLSWCRLQDIVPLNATAFGKAMTALGYERAKRGGTMRYEGIAIAAVWSAPVHLAINNLAAGA